jgi:hypothetical protein
MVYVKKFVKVILIERHNNPLHTDHAPRGGCAEALGGRAFSRKKIKQQENLMFKEVSISNLLKLFPQAECCDCSKNPENCPEDQFWIIYKENIIYCPKCAKNKGLY